MQREALSPRRSRRAEAAMALACGIGSILLALYMFARAYLEGA